jgi:membrane protein YqaA with SNARE-associated domain
MGFFSPLIKPDSVWKWIHRLGGPGLIFLGVADSAPFASAPAGSADLVLILLSAHRGHSWAYYAFMTTLGEVVGGYLTYRLAEKGGEKILEKKVGKQRAEKVYRHFEKGGFATVFIGSILPPPFPFTPVLMAAGVMQYQRKKFLSALTAGRALRFFAAAYLGRIYGLEMIDFFSRHYRAMLYLLIAVAVTGSIGALIYFKRRQCPEQHDKRGQDKPVEEHSAAGQHPVTGDSHAIQDPRKRVSRHGA